MIELTKVKDWSEIVLKWITIIAIPVGGWWAYHNYSITGTAELSPNINISTEVLLYDAQNALLVVHVKPHNVGKVPISLTGGKKGGDISIAIRALPEGLKQGRVNEDKLPKQDEIVSVVSEYEGSYIIEPGVEYDDVWSFVVPKGKTYFARAELDLPSENIKPENGDEVDATAVVKVR